MSSTFDPSTFLDATVTTALTRRPPLNAGADFTGVIGELQPRQWTGKTDPTKSGVAVDVPVEIDLNAYPSEKDRLGVDKVFLKDSIMLDRKEDGSLDMSAGKNGKLRRYREALGMNEDGQPFSIRQMQGRQIKVKIKHRTYEGEVYEEVDGVAKA